MVGIFYRRHPVACPSISTGAYRYPQEEAAGIALAAIRDTLSKHGSVKEVYIVCFEAQTEKIYRSLV